MTNENTEIDYIGIDVSKHTLEVAFGLSKKTVCYDNTLEGIKKLLSKIELFSMPLIVLEPTGGYEMLVEQACYTANVPVCSILANRVRDFAKASGQLAKNDRIDAKILLEYGQIFKLSVDDSSVRKNPEFKALMKRREQITRLIAQEKNHLESAFNQTVQENIKENIKHLISKLKELEKILLALVDDDEELKEKSKYLKSIKGVGDVLTMQCLSSLPELGYVSNKEITALVGVVPYVRESGQYQGQARIYGGRADIRRVLYMAGLSAIQFNTDIKNFYQRLKAKGKPFKVAMVACMRKLLIMMNVVCEEKRLWQESYA